MADTIIIETPVATVLEVGGPQGPQGVAGATGATGSAGAAGQGVPVGGTTGQVLRKASGTNYDTEWAAAGSGSGTITSVALAGTGLSISGSPVTTSGTITANVSYGTTAGTACQGNDSRLSNARTPSAHTHPSADITDLKTNGNAAGLWDSVNDEQLVSTGDGELIIRRTGQTYGGAFNAGQLTADRGYDLPNASGTLALTTTVVDNAAGLWSSTNAVTGLTVTDYTLNVYDSADASAIVFPPTYSGIYTLPNASGTLALTQQATDYEVTNSSAGIIMKSPNNSRWRITIDNNGVLLRTALTLLFSLSFVCGAKAQVRDLVYGTNNVVVGPTNTNALSFTNSVAFSNPLTFGTNAATTRTNLGVTVASNLPAPYSGAAASNSLLTADGAGGSSFVANRMTVSALTTNVVRTNWVNVGADKATNDTGLSLSYSANTLYKLRWALYVGSTWSNFAYGLSFSSTNTYTARVIHTTLTSSQPTGITLSSGATNYTLATETGNASTIMVWGETVWMPTNAGTVNMRFWTSSSNTNTSTLFSNSVITLEKLYP
jgi:hypothetical protein